MQHGRAYWRLALPSLVLLFLVWAPDALGARSDTIVSYTLEARLPSDGSVSSVQGEGTITLTNGASSALSILAFQIYMNAYKPNSLALQSAAKGGRAAIRGGGLGGIEVHSLRDLRTDTALTLEYAEHASDHTTAIATLPTPLEPGATIELGLSFTTSFPRLVQRTGHARDYLFAGQWFPKLAKLESDGTFTQFPFHPQAEFYSNFGNYDVTIDAPEHMVIAAPGLETDATHHNGRRRQRFVAHRIHDYAWSAWADYEIYRDRVGKVALRVFVPPGHDSNARRTIGILQRSLPFFQSWLGAYPYDTLTVIHPPVFAADAGGMEYPTLITTGGAWPTSHWTDDLERVTLHELAHQWFYGLLASNEHAWPFMDEGLTTFAENRAMEVLFDTRASRLRQAVSLAAQRQVALARGHDFPIAAPAPDFPSFSHLAALAYQRTALVLDTLRRVYGASFERALQAYSNEHRFSHPTPEDLLTAIEKHIDTLAAETTREALFHRGWVNYKLTSITHAIDDAASKTGQLNAHEAKKKTVSRLLVTRQGSLQFPVRIEFTDAEGQRFFQRWSGESGTHEVAHTGDTPIVRACVDAERTVTVDERFTDNCLSVTPQGRPWLRGMLAVLMQLLLLAVAW